MNWRNVRYIFEREVRDQLRDRRTLFMILVLPVLLYPLLGLSMFQLTQFIQEHATRVLVIGAENLGDAPPLVDGDGFDASLFSAPDRASLLRVTRTAADGKQSPQEIEAAARRGIDQGEYEAVVRFEPDFAARLADAARSLTDPRGDAPREAQGDAIDADAGEAPSPWVYFESSNEKSQITAMRLAAVLDRWIDRVGKENLERAGLNRHAARPFEPREIDLADARHRDAAVWAKVLPFLLLIWALTGAFYPAVDLCAGEKERGTLETLLVSPAERGEIVWGKLLAVMLFSVATAVLNLLSMGVSFSLIVDKVKHMPAPPAMAMVWLGLALVPVSALFSALCLALAAFAKSSKEGQYYLMPVLLVTLPLAMLPMAPNVELNLGNSLIPLTGVVLLLRSVLEGDHLSALAYLPAVLLTTVVCCLLAIRWAVDQFNQESVLFRESERGGLRAWTRHLLRDREPIPTQAAAVLCAVLILVVRFAIELRAAETRSFADFARLAVLLQVAAIAAPALLLTRFAARSPRDTLGLRWPRWSAVPAAVGLAIMLQPLSTVVQRVVERLYPLNPELERALGGMLNQAPSVWALVALLVVVPAVCEELAFRGFILAGFRRSGHTAWAVALTSFCFAITHSIVPQAIMAFLLGLVLGYVAVQSGSILPPIAFHATNNALAILLATYGPRLAERAPWTSLFMNVSANGAIAFSAATVMACTVVAAAIAAWMTRWPHPRTAEERLAHAMRRAGTAA